MKNLALLSVLIEWLTLKWSGPEEQAATARLLNTILLILLVAGGILFPVGLTLSPHVSSLGLPIGVLIISNITIMLFILRRGHLQIAGFGICSILTLALTYTLWIYGLQSNAVITGFFILIALAALILGENAALIFGILSLLLVSGCGALISLKWIEPAITMPSQFNLLILLTTLSMMMLLMHSSTRALTENINRARRNEQAVRESHQALELAHKTLEERNAYLKKIVRYYIDHMARISEGYLATRIELETLDDPEAEILQNLGQRLNILTTDLEQMILQIGSAAINLNNTATEILATTTKQTEGTQEQAGTLAQTVLEVEQVKAIARQAFLQAQTVTAASQRTQEISRSGQQAVQETIVSMTGIREQVEGIAESLRNLSTQTRQVGAIITTVNQIAAQSNLLALNAAIEAARAGEHGQGFAVVALEIRGLAEQSGEATLQVKNLLSQIQHAAQATAQATEEGIRRVDEGMQLAARGELAITQLTQAIDESARAALEMQAGGRQQTAGIEQIVQAMRNIEKTTHQNLFSSHQTQETALTLNELASKLIQVIANYQTKEN